MQTLLRHPVGYCSIVIVGLLTSGCAVGSRPNFTAMEQEVAVVPGFPHVRTWGDGSLDDFRRFGIEPPAAGTKKSILALSSGGSGGASGAGVLVGWTKSGLRPKFDIVSGVSTGALMAPFAFLGSAYDEQLTALYTGGVTADLVRPKPLLSGVLGTSLFEPEPLRRLIEKYATSDLLNAIATEHRKGRRLLAITTNMDAQRPVVWNMGEIAASTQPGALKLFQDVLMASASIPAVFPPVLIDVEAGGRPFQEMHSDGAAATQVFTIPDGVLAASHVSRVANGADADLYIIVNNTLDPEFEVVRQGTLPVGVRGLSTVLKSQIRGSIVADFNFARQAGIGFHVAANGHAIPSDNSDPFNTEYMRKLYQLGFDAAASDKAWHTTPPFRSVRMPPPVQRVAGNAAR